MLKYKVGDHVKILPVSYRTNYANAKYAGRTGVIESILPAAGFAHCYKVVLDEPCVDFGYTMRNLYVYDFNTEEQILEVI